MKPARYFDWNVHEKWATFNTREPIDSEMVEKIKELPGVDSVVQPHLRYSLTLYKGTLFEWKEIEDSIYALYEQKQEDVEPRIMVEPVEKCWRASLQLPNSFPCVAYHASPLQAVSILRDLFPKQTNGVRTAVPPAFLDSEVTK